MIHDSQQGFEFSRLNSLLSWAFSRPDKKKLIEISMDLWLLNNMKVILTTVWTLNYVDCIPFSCIDSFHIVHNRAN